MNSNIITKYFTSLSDRQLEQYEALGNLYSEWNAKINVISRKDIDNLYEHHILHSLACAKFFGELTPGTTLLDMGTGGGFPGIPLAINYPDCHIHLIDRIGKKIKVAQAISEAIGLTNVTFQHGDIGECRLKFDYVVSRAVMRLDALLPLIAKNISPENRNAHPNGLVCLKGGDLTDESAGLKYAVYDFPLNEYFSEEFFSTKQLIYVPMR